MWKARTKIVPVVTVGSGTIKKGSDQNLQMLPVGHRATEGHTAFKCWGKLLGSAVEMWKTAT
jgi:hypothetical protein